MNIANICSECGIYTDSLIRDTYTGIERWLCNNDIKKEVKEGNLPQYLLRYVY